MCWNIRVKYFNKTDCIMISEKSIFANKVSKLYRYTVHISQFIFYL